MSEPQALQLDHLVSALDETLDDAEASLKVRPQWKSARAFLDELSGRRAELADAPEALEEMVRETEAQRDLLDLFLEQSAEEQRVNDQVRRDRLREDEQLLTQGAAELKVYQGLIVAAFVLPPFLMLYPPIAKFLLLGLMPAGFGYLQVRQAFESFEGRAWLVLLDRVNQLEDRVRKTHMGAIGSVLLALLWLVLAMLRVEAQTG